MIIFITGLSSSGKTTTCEKILTGPYPHNFILLDNDQVRKTVNTDLSFDAAGRHENIRRVTEIACILSRQGYVVLCAFTAPTNHLKELVKQITADRGQACSIVKLNCPLEICAKRNNNHLYEKKDGVITDKCGTPGMAEQDTPGLVDLYLDSSDEEYLDNNVNKIVELVTLK